jgi:manganese transport protein
MPHVIYLHSAMTQTRVTKEHDTHERSHVLTIQRVDVVSAMTVAGVVNVAILAVSAALFFRPGQPMVDTIQAAYAGIAGQVGSRAALAFALALLASGLAASSVGTYAGQVVMLGFIRRTVPLNLRRLVTIAPALLILGLGIDPTETLIVSQVILSFGIPFALVPLVSFTRRRDIMGSLVNRHRTTWAAGAVSGLVIAMNALLLIQIL